MNIYVGKQKMISRTKRVSIFILGFATIALPALLVLGSFQQTGTKQPQPYESVSASASSILKMTCGGGSRNEMQAATKTLPELSSCVYESPDHSFEFSVTQLPNSFVSLSDPDIPIVTIQSQGDRLEAAGPLTVTKKETK